MPSELFYKNVEINNDGQSFYWYNKKTIGGRSWTRGEEEGDGEESSPDADASGI